MNATSKVSNGRSERLRSVGLAVLIGLLIIAQIGTAVAAQDSSDSCASSLVDSISQAGLDVQISAPALGCRQAEDGTWYMPPISATSEGLVTQQLTIEGKVLLASVDRMSIDRAFGSSLRFTRDDSTVHVPGVGGVVSSSDVSNDDIATGPSWRNNVRNSYNQSMMVYLTRTAGTEGQLVFYIEWFMARRDTTLLTMVGQSNPLAATAFLDTYGYQQFPWPWQLADQAAIAAYMRQGPLDFSPEYTPEPRPTPQPTPAGIDESSQGTSSGPIFSPAQLTVVPGEAVDITISLPPTTFSGGFILTVTLPAGLELTNVPQCTPVVACEGATLQTDITQSQGGSTSVEVSGLLRDRDDPASFAFMLEIPEQVPTEGTLLVTAELGFMSRSAPSNLPVKNVLEIVFENPAAPDG